ncbi:O-methyltransferase 1, chloroplastic isoform X2 [Arachis duranensis]|uniref:O-methyltransferase 1, chloroplastic isoform X2 n=1 Tax=Arachis duranensis TaxID=130453 RepID=A0A9C6WQ74_ARADU|nr:O-methyltransferase 1, chloroplastic isoform X2 [Arachis duranensis]
MAFIHVPAIVDCVNMNMNFHLMPLRCNSKRTFCVSAVNLNNDSTNNNDPLLLSATTSAFLRSQETLRPDPLFVDQYASCLVPQNFHKEKLQDLNPYCLATKFIDDKLLHTVNLIDGVKQVVLLTDGMDTRPYRLQWPASTIIFDISPERIFQIAAEKLEGAGAKVPKGSLFYHIPLESSDIKQNLQLRGYNGSRPSIWAMQGFPMMTLANFEEVLSMLSSLAMEGSFFLGELPTFLSDAETDIKSNTKPWLNKLFMSNGFRVEMINHKGVSESSKEEFGSAHYSNKLFVAEQLRLSDDQMEAWRRQFQRVEDEGDEEGFEEL